jgi:hypothetical protein
MSIELLDVVMLEVDLPKLALKRGDAGTVVEFYSDGAAEVEFVTVGGYTKALATLTSDQFSPLDPQDILAVRRQDAA